MKSTSILIIAFQLVGFCALAQKENIPSKTPKYRITLHNKMGQETKGLLLSKNDSALNIFSGSTGDWKSHGEFTAAYFSYPDIETVRLKRRNGTVKGLLIGFGIGFIPWTVAMTGPKQQGGAYVGMVTLPLGILVGGLVGSLSHKTFHIGGQQSSYREFNNRIKL